MKILIQILVAIYMILAGYFIFNNDFESTVLFILLAILMQNLYLPLKH